MTLLNQQTNSSLDLVFESIESCVGHVDYIIAKIQHLIGFYHAGDVDQANSIFIEIVDLMDLYIQLIAKIYRSIKNNIPEKHYKTENISRIEIHLLSVIKAILQAKEKEDIVMLCDLLEYELVDNLIQWKIKILPELKKLKTTQIAL